MLIFCDSCSLFLTQCGYFTESIPEGVGVLSNWEGFYATAAVSCCWAYSLQPTTNPHLGRLAGLPLRPLLSKYGGS